MTVIQIKNLGLYSDNAEPKPVVRTFDWYYTAESLRSGLFSYELRSMSPEVLVQVLMIGSVLPVSIRIRDRE